MSGSKTLNTMSSARSLVTNPAAFLGSMASTASTRRYTWPNVAAVARRKSGFSSGCAAERSVVM